MTDIHPKIKKLLEQLSKIRVESQPNEKAQIKASASWQCYLDIVNTTITPDTSSNKQLDWIEKGDESKHRDARPPSNPAAFITLSELGGLFNIRSDIRSEYGDYLKKHGVIKPDDCLKAIEYACRMFVAQYIRDRKQPWSKPADAPKPAQQDWINAIRKVLLEHRFNGSVNEIVNFTSRLLNGFDSTLAIEVSSYAIRFVLEHQPKTGKVKINEAEVIRALHATSKPMNGGNDITLKDLAYVLGCSLETARKKLQRNRD